MRIETKTYVLIVLTLVIGMVIGALINGAIVRHRIRRFMSMGHPDHLTERLEGLIDPSAAQRDTVHQILMEHAQKFHEIHGQFENQLLALKDSLKKDLDPVLTEEQKKRLERVPKPPDRFGDRRPGQWNDHRPDAPLGQGMPRGERPEFPGPEGNRPPPPPEGDQPPSPPPSSDGP